MRPEWILAAWTIVGLTWWILSYRLVATAGHSSRRSKELDERRLTVFKPLPPLGEEELARVFVGLKSFIAALDDNSELIIGCHEIDRPRVQSLLDRTLDDYPRAKVELVTHTDPNGYANPKIAWMRILAGHATGELWLWSDADIQIPHDAIRSLRADLAASGAATLTSPYVMSHDNEPKQMLDALFVNVEFYPGVVLLGRLNLIRFGFGSGMLFEADAFRRTVNWDFLGSCLAEDFHLARLLSPARLGSKRFVATSCPRDWGGALLHYLRWQKTIRWCRPGSFLAQLIILPILGWLAWAVTHPGQPVAWLALVGLIAVDSVTALAIFRTLGYPIRGRARLMLPLWSVLRGVTWLACWLPWPIVWRGDLWWTPQRPFPRRSEVLESDSRASSEQS